MVESGGMIGSVLVTSTIVVLCSLVASTKIWSKSTSYIPYSNNFHGVLIFVIFVADLYRSHESFHPRTFETVGNGRLAKSHPEYAHDHD